MILVTGGTGIVGSHLLLLLIAKKKDIVATYRDSEKIKKVFNFFKKNKKEEYFKSIIWKQADINDLSELNKAFEGVQFVYHCAAFVSFAFYHRDKLVKNNIEGTANIVNFCVKNNVKKIAYVSSIAALGAENEKELVSEKTPWNNEIDHTVYAYSKYGAELEVWRGTQEGGPAVIVNPGVILAPYFWKQSSGALFSTVNKGMRFYPIGKTGFVTIEDVVFTLHALMESEIKNERYILVAKNNSFRDIFNQIARILNKKPPQIPLKKSLLLVFYVLDKIRFLFRVRKSFMSMPLINSICNEQEFDGSKITRHLPFKYKSISESLDKIGTAYLNRFL